MSIIYILTELKSIKIKLLDQTNGPNKKKVIKIQKYIYLKIKIKYRCNIEKKIKDCKKGGEIEATNC